MRLRLDRFRPAVHTTDCAADILNREDRVHPRCAAGASYQGRARAPRLGDARDSSRLVADRGIDMENAEEQLYDSFGNYIGPELGSEDSDDDGFEDGGVAPHRAPTPNRDNDESDMALTDADPSSAIVLADDKQLYSTAAQVFGLDTEALVEEEDTQRISEPLVAPMRTRVTVLQETEESTPRAKYDYEYFATAILPNPALCRNIALIGNIHHGKTTFCDMLLRSSHDMTWDEQANEPLRYMDARPDEQKLQISVKTNAATLLLPTLSGKSYGVTVLDTPGHPNFTDEAVAALNIVDGAVVFVDVAEGVGLATELLLRKAVLMRLDIVLVLSKLDRLVLELRIPPADAYHKIRHIIETVNDLVVPLGARLLSPARGNVAFCAAAEQVCFTLHQFAGVYLEKHGGPLSAAELAKRFWGDSYYEKETRTFAKKRPSSLAKRTFVEFVLEPLYKLHTTVLSDDVDVLTEKLARNNIHLSQRAAKLDVRALLRSVLGSSFGLGSTVGFVEMLTKFVLAPDAAAKRKVTAMGLSPRDDILPLERDWVSYASLCDAGRESPLIGYVGKLAQRDKKGGRDGVEFQSLFRILSGRLRNGDEVRVLGDDYHVDRNDEEQAGAVVGGISLACGRFAVDVSLAVAGQIVLVHGIDETIFKSATVVAADHVVCNRAGIFRPLPDFLSPGVVKIAVEPIRPSELPKMIAGLRMCLKSYPGLSSKVEESGEHTLLGPGELYMDCVMRDLRETFAEIEIKVSDPVVPFAETVVDTSALQCSADTPNKQNKLTMIAEPLEDEVSKALREGRFARTIGELTMDETSACLRGLGWDSLAAKSLWAFGPHPTRGPNALLNDVLDPEAKRNASSVQDSVVQGFNWAMREGPLADEPVRGVKFRLLDATVSESPIGRSPAQLIPAARRAAYSSMLTASPRLLEPVYLVEVTCPQEALTAVYTIVQRRRGTPLSDGPVAGTQLFSFRGLVPVLDSFGLEADIRGLTIGAAYIVQVFDHWAVVPGDPLDRTVELRPLEPAGRRELARECMVKTRRRKGMPDEVSVVQYFDDPLVAETLRSELGQLL
jgi:116 kDa U5 small nuclear ribonucleoprotein component